MRPAARWVVRADDTGGHWTLSAPEPWDPAVHGALLLRPAEQPTLAAFDLPVGVPMAWAERVGMRSFRHLLAAIGTAPWHRFAEPAATVHEISLHRPFYPRRPGGTTQAHLVQGLGLDSPDQLRRACDRGVPGRIGAAAPVFWLVGAQQVGKGALSAWTDVIAPAVATPHVRLWPADGPLAVLMAPGTVVVAESYPRAAYTWPLGFPRSGWSKRRPSDRRRRSREALAWMSASGLSIAPSREMTTALEGGFGPHARGEDPFDAAMGAIQAVAVLEGLVPDMPPGLPGAMRRVEGWILGRPASRPGTDAPRGPRPAAARASRPHGEGGI